MSENEVKKSQKSDKNGVPFSKAYCRFFWGCADLSARFCTAFAEKAKRSNVKRKTARC